MAKARAFCTCKICGKDFERTKQMAAREIDSWVAWTEANITICPDCELEQAEAKQADSKLPPLEGSPKQIAWAVSIREGALEALEQDRVKFYAALERLDDATKKQELTQKVIEFYEQAAAEAKNNTTARFWIDVRSSEQLIAHVHNRSQQLKREYLKGKQEEN